MEFLVEQSQGDAIIEKLDELAAVVSKQNGRIGRLEHWTRIPAGYKGDGTDSVTLGGVIRGEMGDALRDFFSVKRLSSYLGLIVLVITVLDRIIGLLH